MKNKKALILKVFTVFLSVLILLSCGEKETDTAEVVYRFDKDTSYALGMVYGTDIRDNSDQSGFIPDYNELLKGFKDSLNKKGTRFSIEEALELINGAFDQITLERMEELKQNEIDFLAENSRKPGVMITSSGLQYEVITEGDGPKPSIDDIVRVHYMGIYADGSFFDSSYQRGTPVDFRLNENIFGDGWTEGLLLMNAGSNYILYVPSNLAFGPEGLFDPYSRQQIVPQYATIIFNVELFEVIKE